MYLISTIFLNNDFYFVHLTLRKSSKFVYGTEVYGRNMYVYWFNFSSAEFNGLILSVS